MSENTLLLEKIGIDGIDIDTDSDNDGDISDVADVSQSPNGISEAQADLLYQEAGTWYSGQTNDHITVMPKPLVMYTEAERLISDAKSLLKIQYALDPFQIQALLGKSHKKNFRHMLKYELII